MEFKVYQASFVLNDFHRQATDVIDPTPPPTPPTIWKTVSGNPIQILDALASPMQKCEVTLEPIQSGSGDPSPDNVRPITGWTGTAVNVSDADTSNLTTYSVTFPAVGINIYNSTANPIEQGSILGANGQDTESNARVRTNGYIPAEASKLYYVSFTGLTRYYVHCYASDNSYLGHTSNWVQNGESFTTLADTTKIRIVFATYPDATIRPSSISNIQVRDNVLYGGTYDFVSGVLTVDRALATLTHTMSWERVGVTVSSSYFYLDDPVVNGKSAATWSDVETIGNWASKTVSKNIEQLTNGKYYWTTTTGAWRVGYGTTTTTLEQFLAFLQNNPLQIVCPLSNPIEIALTPQQVSTLAGENNVWGDGTIELTYLGLE